MPQIDIETYLKKIDKLTNNGNLEQAAFHCLYLLRQFPKMIRIYEKLGRAFLEMDNYSAALGTYLRLCSAQPDNLLNHISLAYTYVECGRTENAIVHCETASCLEPDNQTVGKELTNWMASHSVSFSSDDKLLSEFSAGIHAYKEKKYQDACRHFLAAEKRPRPNLPILYLGLSYFESGDTSKGRWLLETVLKREPYNMTALRTLCVFYSDHDQMKFRRCLDKLIELDPYYLHWELRDNRIFPQHYPIDIAYYEWTGIPNTRVRIGWHQASEKLILNDNSRLPEWLDLLPIAEDPVASEETIASLMSDYENAISTEGFYRKSFFSSKNIIGEPSAGVPNDTDKKSQNSGSELDRAFNYLEHVASRGFNPLEPKVSQSENNNEQDREPPIKLTVQNDRKEPAEEEKTVPASTEPTVEDRQMMREAWRCFSTDQQELGVQLYQKLVEKPNCVSAVREELEKLVILFPDNTDVAELYNSLQE